MKIKIIIIAVILTIFSAGVYADIVRVKTPEINGKILILSENLLLTDWQAVISCHFDYKGSRKESIRYPHTIIRKIADTTNEYSLDIKKSSLSEYLPNWKLLTCAYKIILLGKNTNLNKTIMGEIYLLGQEHGQMDVEDLKDMQDSNYVAKVLEDKTHELKLNISAGVIVAE